MRKKRKHLRGKAARGGSCHYTAAARTAGVGIGTCFTIGAAVIFAVSHTLAILLPVMTPFGMAVPYLAQAVFAAACFATLVPSRYREVAMH